jgi:ubiquinone/menaquinone biosynthesis C-methylase UbiE
MSEYDAFAEKFSLTRQYDWPEFQLLSPFLKKNATFLDLGCGNGRFRKFLSPHIIPHGKYFGIDISKKLLQIAQKEFPKDYFFYGDFGKQFSFKKETFDVVVSIAAFHHLLSHKSQRYFLSECYRVLKPNGILFLTTWKLPKKYFWKNILSGRWKNWNIPFGEERHMRTYRQVSGKTLKKLLQEAGFFVEQCNLFREKNYVTIGKK